MTLDEAVDLVIHAFEHAQPGEILVQKASAATIETLARAIISVLERPNHPIDIIGTRHGEKLYEALLSREEMVAAKDQDKFFCVPPDLRDLNYGKYIEEGEMKISSSTDYNSHNTTRLDLEEMKKMLLKLPFIKALVKGEPIPPEI
jgi:UDP-glucose 4-epimerase